MPDVHAFSLQVLTKWDNASRLRPPKARHAFRNLIFDPHCCLGIFLLHRLCSDAPLELLNFASFSHQTVFFGGLLSFDSTKYSSNDSRLGLAVRFDSLSLTRIPTLLVLSCVPDQPSCGAPRAWSVATGKVSPLPCMHRAGLILNGVSALQA